MSKNFIKQSPAIYIGISAVAAVTAAAASASSLAFGLPVWAMFIGWVAFFTRGMTVRDGAINLGCVWIGIAIGALAALAIGALSPSLGMIALPVVVFVVAIIVVSLRAVPTLNNILGYFLGLIAFFAAHLEPTLGSVAELAAASGLGSVAGLLSMKLQQPMFASTK